MQLFVPLDSTSKSCDAELFDDCANSKSSWSTSETPITGRDGVTLESIWDPCPEAYMGVTVPYMPNFFMYLGPAGAPGSGSFVTMLEFVVEYIIKCVKKLQREYFHSLEPT